ncbi:MAG: tRNA pseudouridine55 synthase [Humisphaera sp.]|nr:tRNA pseudouridine55 synthase [Humisphaera sp.]
MSIDGILNLDKPAGISSARAVDKVKRLLPRKTKIGHAGTLDPFATGVLVLLIGKGTKLCERLMDQPKQYEATIKFGATTATDDPDSPEEPHVSKTLGRDAQATREAIGAVLPRFIGTIQQRPPAFSALKVGGQRAYKLARGGAEVKLEPRMVQVYGIELLDFAWPLLRLRIDCGRGTYIRSIARDLGEALDVGGHLTQLRRTRVGDFAIDRAVTLEQLHEDGVEPHLAPLP